MIIVNNMEDMSTLNETNATSTENSIEIAGNHEMAHTIDRLSLLPNELLDHIFDLAYSIDTPSTGPLSKRLLPFHITGIYRRISLTKPINIARLIEKINKSPELQGIVVSLRLVGGSRIPLADFDVVEIDRFFRRLDRLEWLDLGDDGYGLLPELIPHGSRFYLPRLRHLTSAASSHSQYPLLDFASIPNLRSLFIVNYNVDYGAHESINAGQLLCLTHLEISGIYADDLSIATFCSLCPSLAHVTLAAPTADYSPLLRQLSNSLIKLELRTLDEDGDDLCEQELSRFIALRHLVLGDGMFTSALPSHLLGLRALETLKLGQGRISTNGMQELFDQVPINHLKLDLTKGRIGYRLEVNEAGSVGGRWIPGEGRLIAGDWVIPEFDLQEAGDFTLEGAREMVRAAEELGIEVEGSIIRSIEVMDAYYLEIANIAIYRCFRDKTIEHYLEVRTHNLGDRLPSLDLDSLDPTRLKIRKIELEGEGWFALTLEN
ncbi:hypothetical protein JCM5353_006597 [Sporobolomyces roseus]